jgi:hypothetical protein
MKEDHKLMRTSELRYVILVMGAGHITILHREFKLDSIEVQK